VSNADRERFYAERDRRTVQYGAAADVFNKPIAITVDADLAATRPGQIALLGLIEMLPRVHRSITIVAEHDHPLVADTFTDGATLLDAFIQRATAIDPFVQVSPSRGPVPDGAVMLGVGASPPAAADVYVGWDGGTGILDTAAVPCGLDTDHVVGAATAACLGAAALFRLAHGQQVRPARINLVELIDGDRAGTGSVTGPIDVGDVVVIGAGAVTHALAYWAGQLGVCGNWTPLDRDLAELHNTNRCLGMTAADAGWPNGIPNGQPRYKAETAAELLGTQPATMWFHEWLATGPARPDLYLCLANEHGIRPTVAAHGEPVLLHATTSPNWTAELHRHIPGRDDCPACRLPETTRPAFACSTGKVDPTDANSGDAALPFLSAAAGLMLAVALCQLPERGPLVTNSRNHWRLHFDPAIQLRASRWPGDRCPHVLLRSVRAGLQARAPRRWDHLDRPQ
jgi:hypothetical protein